MHRTNRRTPARRRPHRLVRGAWCQVRPCSRAFDWRQQLEGSSAAHVTSCRGAELLQRAKNVINSKTVTQVLITHAHVTQHAPLHLRVRFIEHWRRLSIFSRMYVWLFSAALYPSKRRTHRSRASSSRGRRAAAACICKLASTLRASHSLCRSPVGPAPPLAAASPRLA